jgi:hypothetical protein
MIPLGLDFQSAIGAAWLYRETATMCRVARRFHCNGEFLGQQKWLMDCRGVQTTHFKTTSILIKKGEATISQALFVAGTGLATANGNSLAKIIKSFLIW